MKTVLSLGLGLLALLLVLNIAIPTGVDAAQRATSTPRRTATPAVMTYYVTAAANGRKCAKLTCDVIEKYVAGEAVEVLDEVEGDSVRGSDLWYEVKVSRTSSVFVHSSLLTDKKPVPRATARSGNSSGSGSTTSATAAATESAPPASGASCPSMSATCSQLTCDQARACLAAGNQSLDRDKDGKPCETQCGG